MSDTDMLEVAKYASSQPGPQVEAISNDTALPKKGAEATAVLPCGGCHVNDWKGFSANPRIGGQSTAYLAAAFRQFRSGSRANSPALIGPGAWSIYAHLFGWRRLEIRDRKSQDSPP
jgi:hypothetical protein